MSTLVNSSDLKNKQTATLTSIRAYTAAISQHNNRSTELNLRPHRVSLQQLQGLKQGIRTCVWPGPQAGIKGAPERHAAKILSTAPFLCYFYLQKETKSLSPDAFFELKFQQCPFSAGVPPPTPLALGELTTISKVPNPLVGWEGDTPPFPLEGIDDFGVYLGVSHFGAITA